MTASTDTLCQLHEQLSASLKKALRYYESTGEPPPPSLIKEVREFLKDNGIDAALEPGADATELLRDAVPFIPELVSK